MKEERENQFLGFFLREINEGGKFARVKKEESKSEVEFLSVGFCSSA